MSEDYLWLVRVDDQSPVYVYSASDDASAFAKFDQLRDQYGSAIIGLGPWPGSDKIARDEEPLEDIVDHVRHIEFEHDENFDAIGIVIGVIGSAMFWFTLILLGKASAEGWFNG